MREFLRDGRRSIELSHVGSLAPDDPLALLLAGQKAAMKEDHEGAARAFESALRAAPKGWPRRSDALLALLSALERGKKPDACLERALTTLAGSELSRSPTLADFCSYALDCAAESNTKERAKRLRELVQKTLVELALDPLASLSADDRGDALRIAWDAREALGDHAGALEAAKLRLDVLDKAAKLAPTPAVASTFDGARTETLVFLGRANEAVRFLRERERELPDDYNPPHRLALAYDALGERTSALDALDRAIAKAWGARKARMLDRRADILEKLERKADAATTIAAELELLQSLPPGQKKPELEAKASERLGRLRSDSRAKLKGTKR
jgi:tetratricopeptide (TPR) repeat protein